MVDFLIVGQGLAGTLLGHFLTQSGATIAIVGDNKPNVASKVAAGLINPITGRRYVKSWRIDQLLPIAQDTYHTIGELLSKDYYHAQPIIRTLNSVKEENDWWGRSTIPAYEQYIAPSSNLGSYQGRIVDVHATSQTNGGAQVDIGDLVKDYAQYWLDNGTLRQEEFYYNQLHDLGDSFEYKDIVTRKVVFCEGANAVDNPWFGELPYNLSKGEVLVVRIPDVDFDRIFKHKLFIIPKGDDIYWIGSVYDWDFVDELPTTSTREKLVAKLEATLTVPFEVVDHLAAIRPTVKDRRPFLGQHDVHPHFYIFNGLGTKGTSLGPFWAQEMTQYLLGKKELDKEVDIARFR